MMKWIRVLISIGLIVGLVFGAIYFKKTAQYESAYRYIHNAFYYVEQYINAKKHNIGFTLNPPRKKPLTLIERETRLALFLPMVFGSYGSSDWQNFWDKIYEPVYETSGLFQLKRHSSQKEMQDYLRKKYPQVFTQFNEEQWKAFWSIALGGGSE